MIGLFAALISIFILILLVILDFKMGKKAHKKQARFLAFDKAKGDYKLYKNGAPLFEDLFQDLTDARKQIDVLFYLIADDYISLQFIDILKKKAEQGLTVRLMVDRLGGYKIKPAMIQKMREAGVQFSFASKLGFPYFFYKVNRRNHRKILVIDGKIGYAGGFNIGKNYLGENPKFGEWRDYHLRLIGPAVSHLHTILLDDWLVETGEKIEPLPVSDHRGDKEIRFVATDGTRLEQEFLTMIQQAETEIFIGTPYFIPTEKLMTALTQALHRGVHLHIMVPLKADHPLVKPAATPYLKRICQEGGTVSLFDDGFYHAKVMIIDEKIADIGTANFDLRSLFLNKEVNTLVYDPEFIKELKAMFMGDTLNAIALDDDWLAKRSLTTKISGKIAMLLRPLL